MCIKGRALPWAMSLLGFQLVLLCRWIFLYYFFMFLSVDILCASIDVSCASIDVSRGKGRIIYIKGGKKREIKTI